MAEVQTNCILIASKFVIHPQILIFSAFKIVSLFPILIANKIFIEILSSSLNIMLIVDKHCSDEFVVPQIDRKSK